MRRHVYYYTHVPLPAPAGARLLAGDPAAWLPQPAAAAAIGWRVPLHADAALPAALATRDAVVRVGAPQRRGADEESAIVRRIGWQAPERNEWFPVLDAELGLSGLRGGGCQLSLMGTYRAPLSVVGGVADQLVGHRVAEACIRRFVLQVADRLLAAVTMPA